MIHYKCRDCGTSMEAPDSMAGETESCPACGTPNTVTIAQEPTEGAKGQTMTTREWLKREWFKLGLLVLLVPAVWYIALNGIVLELGTPTGYIDVKHHGFSVDFPSSLSLDVSGVDFPSRVSVTGVDFPNSLLLNVASSGYFDVKHHDD